MLQHGGGLISAAKQYNIPLDQWIDLSTGINPDTWPLPIIPERVFNRLPEDDDNLHAVAKEYYQAKCLLAIAGSQSVIQLLPRLREKCRVAVPLMGYGEHAHAWRLAGHDVHALSTEQLQKNLHLYDVVLVINPNNPSAETFAAQQLLGWHKTLQKKAGWLIVDEAFIDTRPENSLASSAYLPGLIVLRSMGKFFGLAGIRSGFVLAQKNLLETIHNELGPWTVTGPSRFITACALADKKWQQKNKVFLAQQSEKLKSLLQQSILLKNKQASIQGTDLFQTIFCDNAPELHLALAKNGVFTRLLDGKQGLRFGLPPSIQWQRLQRVLHLL